MAQIPDFYSIPIGLESFATANFLAKIRIEYEYQRSGHLYNYSNPSKYWQNIGNLLNFKGTLSNGNIPFGILAELLIYNDLTKYLKDNLQEKEKMIAQNFVYNLTIGAYDPGFDFKKDDLTIDVKHYANNICKSYTEMLEYRLLVDKKQFDNNQANLYIQTFSLVETNTPYIVIAGYSPSDMLKLNTKLPNPAYACKVDSLLTYNDLKKKYF